MNNVQTPTFIFKLSEHDSDPIVTLKFVGHGVDQVEAARIAAMVQDHYEEAWAKIIGERLAAQERRIDPNEVREAVGKLVIAADRVVRGAAA